MIFAIGISVWVDMRHGENESDVVYGVEFQSDVCNPRL
jgi:hypothetical protein